MLQKRATKNAFYQKRSITKCFGSVAAAAPEVADARKWRCAASLVTNLSRNRQPFMSALKIYNTLAREKQPFTPIEPGKVRMYVCGMTVYDYCHIGHARVMVVFDLVQRWLRAAGYEVTYVRNITDIDDKIIKRAAENLSLIHI